MHSPHNQMSKPKRRHWAKCFCGKVKWVIQQTSKTKAELVTNNQIGAKANSKAENEETFAKLITNRLVAKVGKVVAGQIGITCGSKRKDCNVQRITNYNYKWNQCVDDGRWISNICVQMCQVYLCMYAYIIRACKKAIAPPRHINWQDIWLSGFERELHFRYTNIKWQVYEINSDILCKRLLYCT